MMYSTILCEGTADQILISYYLQKNLGYEHIHNKEYKKLPLVNVKNLKSEWYKDLDDNKLLILDVSGNDFSQGLDSLFKYNKSVEQTEMFRRICVITDNDDPSAAKRIEQLENQLNAITERVFPLEQACWNNIEIKSGFGETVTISLSFLLQPVDEYGNIETFILNMQAAKDSNDKLVIDKAKTYIKKVKEVCNKKYLKSRGETNKGELSAFFAAVSPQRIFSPINELLRDIDWENYTEYNSQYKLLNDINKDITMNNC